LGFSGIAIMRVSSMTLFTEVQPTLENYWRSIILFGRNVASYKFGLGKSLLELSQQGKEIITLQKGFSGCEGEPGQSGENSRTKVQNVLAHRTAQIWPFLDELRRR